MSFAAWPLAPGPAPEHGQHTSEILREPDYEEAEIARLRAAGAIA